jgi:hypothetical protein
MFQFLGFAVLDLFLTVPSAPVQFSCFALLKIVFNGTEGVGSSFLGSGDSLSPGEYRE